MRAPLIRYLFVGAVDSSDNGARRHWDRGRLGDVKRNVVSGQDLQRDAEEWGYRGAQDVTVFYISVSHQWNRLHAQRREAFRGVRIVVNLNHVNHVVLHQGWNPSKQIKSTGILTILGEFYLRLVYFVDLGGTPICVHVFPNVSSRYFEGFLFLLYDLG